MANSDYSPTQSPHSEDDTGHLPKAERKEIQKVEVAQDEKASGRVETTEVVEDYPIRARVDTTEPAELLPRDNAQEDAWDVFGHGGDDMKAGPPSQVTSPADDPLEEKHDEKGSKRPTGPCPELWCGTKLNKSCPLKADRWTKIGRSKECQLWLQNSGVSRDHCSLKYDSHRQIVEFRDTSTTGTIVNGEVIRSIRKTLAHGDLIRVEGKGIRFDFVLDLRPIHKSLQLPDPVAMAEERQTGVGKKVTKSLLSGPASRRTELREKIAVLDEQLKSADQTLFEKEREYYSIVARRRLRSSEDAKVQKEIDMYTEKIKALNAKLHDSREDWRNRIDEMYKTNEKAAEPLINKAAELQGMLEKLQLKKDELERSLFPEKYAVADISRMPELKEMMKDDSLPSVSQTDNSSVDQSGEEDQAFPELDNRAANKTSTSPPRKDELKVEKKPVVDPMASEIFGDFDSDEEGEAADDKKPASSTGGPGAVAAASGGVAEVASDSDDAPIGQAIKRQKVEANID